MDKLILLSFLDYQEDQKFLTLPANFELNKKGTTSLRSVVNKVPGHWLQGQIDLANRLRSMQIFLHSKFEINRTTGLKVMAKKLTFLPKQIFGHNLWAGSPIDPKFLVWKNLDLGKTWYLDCLLNQFDPAVNSQGLYLVI